MGGGGWELGSWTWRRRRRLGVWTLQREGGSWGGQSCNPRHPRLKQRVGAGTSPALPPVTGGAAFRQAGPRPRPPHPLGPGHPPGWWPESPWLAPPVWGGATSVLPSLTQPRAPHADSAGNRPPEGRRPSGQRPGSQRSRGLGRAPGGPWQGWPRQTERQSELSPEAMRSCPTVGGCDLTSPGASAVTPPSGGGWGGLQLPSVPGVPLAAQHSLGSACGGALQGDLRKSWSPFDFSHPSVLLCYLYPGGGCCSWGLGLLSGSLTRPAMNPGGHLCSIP